MLPGAWGGISPGHFPPMTHAVDVSRLPADSVPGHLLGRLLRIALAALLAASAILLAG